MRARIDPRLFQAVPERTPRVATGTRFGRAAAEAGAAQLGRLARFLHWMTPLESLPKEEQQALAGAAPSRPVAAEEEDEPELAGSGY